MEGNYQPGFYSLDREQQDSRHQPSQQQQQHQPPPPPPQQQQQHAAHYPLELPIPYHTSSQHQSEYAVDHQPLRAFPLPHHAASMLSSIYHDTGHGLPNSNIAHQVRQHPPASYGGHGVKSSTLPANYASPITTHGPVIERNIQPIASRDSTPKSSVPRQQDQPAPAPAQHPKPAAPPPKPAAPPPKPAAPPTNQKEKPPTIHPPPPPPQSNPTPSSPTPPVEEPQLFAALNLKKTNSHPDLPPSLIFKVTPQDKVQGVVAKQMIEAGTEFGPYVGPLLDEEEGWQMETTWEICLSDLKAFLYIDGRKTWMSHIKCVETNDEQNIEAFQYYGKIYFRTTRVIEPGQELRVFYSEEYKSHIGIKTKLKDLRFKEDVQKFECELCESLFASAKLVIRHVRCEHSKPDEVFPVLSFKTKRKKLAATEIPCPPIPSKPLIQSKPLFAMKRKIIEQKGGKFKCGTCKKAFPTRGRLKEHELFHEMMNGPKPYECIECNQKYTAQSSLNRHEREAHGVFDKYTPRSRLKTKPSKEDGSHRYKCSECGKGYKSYGAFVKHERKSHGIPSPVREIATVPEGPKDMLGRPSNYYQRRYKCRFCPKRYSSLTTVEQHEKEVHTGEGTFKCPHCSKLYASESRLREHLVIHKYEFMHKCTLCPRSFASQSALNNHQGEHTGLKPCKCEICGRGFRTRKLLLKHKQRMHQDRPKRFFCSLCNKGFSEKCNLKVHERRHKGIRQFVCLECGRGFTAKFSLTAHMTAMHKKEKPFSCEICGKAFALNHHYNHHMAKHRLQIEDPMVKIQTQ